MASLFRSRLLYSLFFLAVMTLLLQGAVCRVTNPDENPCNPRDQIENNTVLRTDQDYYDEYTEEAKNDCHANYFVYFYWNDPERRKTDSMMPPLDLDKGAFGPKDEWAYFASPLPVRSFNVDHYMWTISFDVGNKNSGRPSTRYQFYTRIDPILAALTNRGGDKDHIFIHSSIMYTPYSTKN